MIIEDIRHTITIPVKLDDMERGAILNALAFTDGSCANAAALLGLARPTIYAKMRRYGIPLPAKQIGAHEPTSAAERIPRSNPRSNLQRQTATLRGIR